MVDMDLKRLPPALLLALGLSCGDDSQGTTTGMDPTVDPNETTVDPNETTTGPCLSTSGFTSTSPSSSVGPCLDVGDDATTTTMGETSTGPCLAPEPPDSSGSSDGGGSDDTGTSTGGSTGMLEAPADRETALRRVLERGALPADVAQRLRGELPED